MKMKGLDVMAKKEGSGVVAEDGRIGCDGEG
jgi:hypothetical protein